MDFSLSHEIRRDLIYAMRLGTTTSRRGLKGLFIREEVGISEVSREKDGLHKCQQKGNEQQASLFSPRSPGHLRHASYL